MVVLPIGTEDITAINGVTINNPDTSFTPSATTYKKLDCYIQYNAYYMVMFIIL